MHRITGCGACDHVLVIECDLSDNTLAADGQAVMAINQHLANLTCTGDQSRYATWLGEENLCMINIGVNLADFFNRIFHDFAECQTPRNTGGDEACELRQLDTLGLGAGSTRLTVDACI